jgi:integrase
MDILFPKRNQVESRASERRGPMGLFRRGQTWWMRFTYKGKQIRKSTETDDKKLAVRIYQKVMGEVAEGKWFEKPIGADKTFQEMMERYMNEHSLPKKASSERDRSSLTHLLPFFGSTLVSEITPKLINQYKANRRGKGASPCTVNRELALMKHSFNLAVREWEWIRENPLLKISMEKEPPARDRWLTYEDEESLLSVCPLWLNEIVIFAIETGCRRDEILSLEWKGVDLFCKVVAILGKKTGERRTIPLTHKAFEVLKDKEKIRTKVRSIREDLVFTHPLGQRVNIHTLRSAFEDALKRAKIEKFRFHDLRHTFASRLAQMGTDPYAIQKLMGHKTFTTTQGYAHHYSESLKKAMEALDTFRTERSKLKLAQN